MKKQSRELTRVKPDRNIFSINVELTSTFLLYRGLVHHHLWILNLIYIFGYKVTHRWKYMVFFVIFFIFIIFHPWSTQLIQEHLMNSGICKNNKNIILVKNRIIFKSIIFIYLWRRIDKSDWRRVVSRRLCQIHKGQPLNNQKWMRYPCFCF